jgi:dolichol-phosphate mannosyltransferase
MMTKTVSVVIPAKNEPYLPELISQFKIPLKYEVIVRSDLGLANAVLRGVKVSTGDAIVVLDADGSHNPKYIVPMLSLLDKYDIVIGSRYIRGGGTSDYFLRMLLSRLFNKLARFMLGIRINDNMSGFIVAKREVFEKLSLKPFGYKFGLEMIVKSKGKFTVTEYPVQFEKRKMGYSKTGFGQGIKTMTFILKLFIEEIVSK